MKNASAAVLILLMPLADAGPSAGCARSADANAPTQQGENRAELVQIRAKSIWVGDGAKIEDGVLLVEGGRIRKVGRGVELDSRVPLVEHYGVITAGIVVCNAQAGAAGEAFDETRALLPEARIADAFSPEHSDFDRAVAAGITTLVLAPTAENVAAGLSAAVKTAGGRVLQREAHLLLSFSNAALDKGDAGFSFFFGAADEELAQGGRPEDTESSRRGARAPTSYSGALAELEQRLARPEGAFSRIARGDLPVILEAWERHEVMRAVRFATKHKLKGALRGASLASDPTVLAAIQASGLGVIVGPFELGQPTAALESVRALTAGGVPTAFALGGSEASPEQIRLSAALAVQAGADAAAVWRALTIDAARVAGIEDRVGLLERGRDADFVLWSGDPLDLRSRVVAVYVDGNLAHGDAR